MDNKRIGLFLANERKAKNLTQQKLAEKLYVSEKTISKWENGNGLPDTTLLPEICEIFGITINELLSGERLGKDDYAQKAEDNLSNLLLQKKDSVNKIILSFIICLISFSTLIYCVVIVSYIDMPVYARVISIVFGLINVIIGIITACILDRNAGTYECKHCKTRFVPTMKSYIAGPHSLTTRMLKCPNCKKVSYCKKRLTK